MKKTTIFLTSIIFLLLIIGIASAGLGMSAGLLNFGEVPRGGEETLSYTIINTGDQPFPVGVKLMGDFEYIATVQSTQIIIPKNSTKITRAHVPKI